MQKHSNLLVILALLALPILACSTLLTEPAAEIPPPPSLTINTPIVDTPAADSFAPTVTPFGENPLEVGTVVPDGPRISAIVDVNVRMGPGVQYERDGFLLGGESAAIVGHDPTSGWWKIQCPLRSDGPECWVTGRSRYTSSANTDDVPIAEVPPTAQASMTPTDESVATATVGAPATSASSDSSPSESAIVGATSATKVPAATPGPLLVYVDNGDLFAATLSREEDGLVPSQKLRLTDNANVIEASISPSGQWVAYLQQNTDENALYLVRPDGSELTKLVDSAQLPLPLDQGTTELTREIAQFQWTSDGETLAFNTRVAAVDLGTDPTYDFWTVQPGSDPLERIPTGQAGGHFAISSENIVLMSTPTEIFRVLLDGSNREPVLAFEFINTASEHAYLPEPQWVSDGQVAHVALPGPEPFGPTAIASLIEIPAQSLSGIYMGGVAGNVLFDPIYWTNDGARLAYIKRFDDREAPLPELILANSDGSNPVGYVGDEALQFLSWNHSGDRFLYAGDGFYAVGRPDEEPYIVKAPQTGVAARGQWVSDESFVVAVGSRGNWELIGNYQNGAPIPLVLLRSPAPIFDTWHP